MEDLWAALGLVLVLEGALYALFPEGMRRMMATVLAMPQSTLRTAGLVSAFIGFIVVWLVRG